MDIPEKKEDLISAIKETVGSPDFGNDYWTARDLMLLAMSLNLIHTNEVKTNEMKLHVLSVERKNPLDSLPDGTAE